MTVPGQKPRTKSADKRPLRYAPERCTCNGYGSPFWCICPFRQVYLPDPGGVASPSTKETT
jgi:hypothetical protein